MTAPSWLVVPTVSRVQTSNTLRETNHSHHRLDRQPGVLPCCRRLTANHLPPHVVAGMAGPTTDPSVSLTGSAPDRRRGLNHKTASTEQDIIEQALFNNNYSRTNTAKELGISRVTLYNKMKEYGLTKESIEADYRFSHASKN